MKGGTAAAKAAAVQKPAAKAAAVQKPAAKAAAVQKPAAKAPAAKAVAAKAAATKFVIPQGSAMTLAEKMAMYRKGGDPSKPLDLPAAQQKQLSSKFNWAFKKADEESQSRYAETVASAGPGNKQAAHGHVVRSWIIAQKFDDKFIELTRQLKQKKSFKQVEKPVSFKELEAKYSIRIAFSNGISQPMALYYQWHLSANGISQPMASLSQCVCCNNDCWS
jgi:hypothetical protein